MCTRNDACRHGCAAARPRSGDRQWHRARCVRHFARAGGTCGPRPPRRRGCREAPAAWPQVVYWVPAPGMMWPMAPAYPAPIPLPYPSAGWRPFVMMWVPVIAQAPASVTADVDYGPVAVTPVVGLPLPASTPEPASGPVPAPAPEGAMRSPAITEPGKPDEGRRRQFPFWNCRHLQKQVACRLPRMPRHPPCRRSITGRWRPRLWWICWHWSSRPLRPNPAT